MVGLPEKIRTWQMAKPWIKDDKTGSVLEGQITQTEIPIPQLQSGEALVEIAGCGVCHTDLGYFYNGVPVCIFTWSNIHKSPFKLIK